MRFARWVFYGSAAYGLLVLVPMYFLEHRLGEQFPPPITHPELYYGFVSVALAWQVAYALIGHDPLRYRPLMLVGAAGKMAFAIGALVLWALGRADIITAASVVPDVVLSLLFVAAFVATGSAPRGDEGA